jgi:hypothetical protein
MVQQTIVTMLAELRASTALAFEAARALDAASVSPEAPAVAWHRLTTALAKYRTGELAVRNASRAIEVLGGNGYVEEYVTARMYREAQVLPVWEGPANIQALEVLRTLTPRWRSDQVMARRVAAVASAAADDARSRQMADLLLARWREAEAAIAWIEEHPAAASEHARRLADFLSEILEFALVLEEAVEGLRAGDERDLVLAWWLVRLYLAPAKAHGLGEDLSWLDPIYDRLTGEERLAGVVLPELRVEVGI